ncbi:MAG TPA: hypothetical protein VMF06_06000 [Candidatus Limnocylindria bacterium]|jgi:hypothetical protein|nr:hypothetical protein [Candidatus Limnocylindria bacterium]
MKTDALKQFVSLREALQAEKSELESRLAEIDQALGSFSPAAAPEPRTPRPYRRRVIAAAPTSGGRRGNPSSLKQMVLDATKAKPLTRQEILDSVLAAGYKFVAKDPLNSLSTLLYTAKEIKNFGGKFGPG